MLNSANASTAALSAPVSAPPKNVTPDADHALVGLQLERDELARVVALRQTDHQRIVSRAVDDPTPISGDLHSPTNRLRNACICTSSLVPAEERTR